MNGTNTVNNLRNKTSIELEIPDSLKKEYLQFNVLYTNFTTQLCIIKPQCRKCTTLTTLS